MVWWRGQTLKTSGVMLLSISGLGCINTLSLVKICSVRWFIHKHRSVNSRSIQCELISFCRQIQKNHYLKKLDGQRVGMIYDSATYVLWFKVQSSGFMGCYNSAPWVIMNRGMWCIGRQEVCKSWRGGGCFSWHSYLSVAWQVGGGCCGVEGFSVETDMPFSQPSVKGHV